MSFFQFKYFSIRQQAAAMKVGTDAMLLGAFVSVANNQKILDVGAGTGILSLMLAQKAKKLKITAIEFDTDALEDLTFNANNSPFDSSISIIHADFNAHQFDECFDLVISNPPFYKNSFSKGNSESRSKARNEENLSFDVLIQKVASILSVTGEFWMIFPAAESEFIQHLAVQNQLNVKSEISIFGKPNSLIRKIICFTKKQIDSVELIEFSIRDLNGNYTESYKELTKEFHAKTV